MKNTPQENEAQAKAARAALRASLAQIESAARLAQQAIDSDQPPTVLGRCIDDIDSGFTAFDNARVAINEQQINALEGWESFVAHNAEKQNAEDVIDEWLQEKRDEEKQ